MKFYIDEDVDLPAVRSVLLDHGHPVWHVTQAARTGDPDASQLAYAIAKDAAVVTHDDGFVGSHRDLPIGRVIRFDCLERDGADSLRQILGELIPLLERNEHVYVTVKRDSTGAATFKATFGTEGRPPRRRS